MAASLAIPFLLSPLYQGTRSRQLFRSPAEPYISDTTAAALTCLFLESATNPDVTRTLQDELDALFQENPEPDNNALSRLKYLQACIGEGLRLRPVVPSGAQRITPHGGLQIGLDLVIPGEVPTYTLTQR